MTEIFTKIHYKQVLWRVLLYSNLIWIILYMINYLLIAALIQGFAALTEQSTKNHVMSSGLILFLFSIAITRFGLKPLRVFISESSPSPEIQKKVYITINKLPNYVISIIPVIMLFIIVQESFRYADKPTELAIALSLELLYLMAVGSIIYLLSNYSFKNFMKYFEFDASIKSISTQKRLGMSIVLIFVGLTFSTGNLTKYASEGTTGSIITGVYQISLIPIIIIITWIILATTIKPVQQMLQISKKFQANPTESLRVDNISADEIGTLMHNFIQMINQSRDQLEKNLQVSEQLIVRATELSSSAEQMAASSENIASSQQQISKGAASTVAAISETQKKFTELDQGIKAVKEKVIRINEISDSIKNISSQTNMLALNAAIEAARAGEAGRGFNVVADQVRKLAEESRKSVSNTEEILNEINRITEIQDKNSIVILKAIDSIASVAEETSSSTEESAAAAEESASSMAKISSTAVELQELATKLTNKSKSKSN